MTPETFLRSLVESALPAFAKNAYDANGMDFKEFMTEKSTETPAVFISYEGFTQEDIYSDGSEAIDAENYSLYLRCDDSVKPHVAALRKALFAQFSEFVNGDGERKFVQFLRGQPFRDNGADAFEISITIK